MLKLLILALFSNVALATVHHDIRTELDPTAYSIWVEDKITLPSTGGTQCETKSLSFKLHSDLNPVIQTSSWSTLLLVGSEVVDTHHKLEINHYLAVIPCSEQSLIIKYAGKIHHPIIEPANPYSRGTSESPGLISPEGVVLSATTYWYPQFTDMGDSLVTFTLNATVPSGWSVVSQGEAVNSGWSELHPQTDIYLIAAAFTKYTAVTEQGVKVEAYLRTPDDRLSEKYLKATVDYLDFYSKLIGPYPYSKFALVENFWETGFGMPSFTLLGSTIIRLPFIINSSYPHEILHNWWGNSVYVDYKKGNWCEGLTAYLADHLMAERSSVGDNYRRDTLMKYTDFVNEKNDFPLTQFLERTDAATEAIGYGKSLMFFHMLRSEIGDANFFKSLTNFYSENSFKQVSYDEIKASLEKTTQRDLTKTFDQWTKRVGAPKLQLTQVQAVKTEENLFKVMAHINQTQTEESFKLNLPVIFHFGDHVVKKNYEMEERELIIEETFRSRPLRLDIDPGFDVFRRLSRDEVPTVLTNAFGSTATLIILPSTVSVPLFNEWKKFSEIIGAALKEKMVVKLDSEITTIGDEFTSVWVLDKNNLQLNNFKALVKDQPLQVKVDGITFNNKEYPFSTHSQVITLRNTAFANQVWTLVTSDLLSSLQPLANKLIHYGKYSILVFESERVANVDKGVWKVTNSSMSVDLPLVK